MIIVTVCPFPCTALPLHGRYFASCVINPLDYTDSAGEAVRFDRGGEWLLHWRRLFFGDGKISSSAHTSMEWRHWPKTSVHESEGDESFGFVNVSSMDFSWIDSIGPKSDILEWTESSEYKVPMSSWQRVMLDSIAALRVSSGVGWTIKEAWSVSSLIYTWNGTISFFVCGMIAYLILLDDFVSRKTLSVVSRDWQKESSNWIFV